MAGPGESGRGHVKSNVQSEECAPETATATPLLSPLALSVRSGVFGLVVLLLALDVCVPPAALPSSIDSRDRLGGLGILTFVWSLGFARQALLSVGVTGVALLLWPVAVGRAWAAGHPADPASGYREWSIGGAVVALCGWYLRRSAKRALAGEFTYQISAPNHLITAGPYRWWLHPGYAGSVAHATGIVMLLLVTSRHRVVLSLAMSAAVVAVLSHRILAEEELLRDHFGEPMWAQYALGRWRIVPFVW